MPREIGTREAFGNHEPSVHSTIHNVSDLRNSHGTTRDAMLAYNNLRDSLPEGYKTGELGALAMMSPQ